MTGTRLTGGCQCGAVRYALHQRPEEPHICHCRMCQKAFGSFFAPLAEARLASFEVTRGRLATFASSDVTERGFCRDCGTPLSLQDAGSDRILVSIGSLDHPEAVVPVRQHGLERRLPFFAMLDGLPGDVTTEEAEPGVAAWIAATNHQHPDHDTELWPPATGDRA
ncbi:MAG: GFA family protein [Bauldia sp.]|nr:GFA family protein [Bauldia sp.]